MEKTYCYTALLISFSFLFQTLHSSSYLLALLIFFIMLLISSKVYKFQGGKELKDSYQNLPLVKFLAFFFKDKDILTSQNHISLSVLMLSTAYGLSMIISFYFYGEEIRHFLLLIGCISFSIIFTKVLINIYVVEGK